ncbi:MAG: T9SS type A sorting domain-containing protein, partial [Calditrichaceae bacterium]|nr:T9SS type A sorting domain-containing protein [Calditrichaceae bacterium]
DFWFSNRPKDLKYFELYENKFSTNTAPNTRSNLNNARSYITLENFSSNTSNVMTFDYKRDFFEPGYPFALFDSSATLLSTIAGTLEDCNHDFVFALNSLGDIFAIQNNGEQPTGLYDDNFLIGNLDHIGNYSSLVLVDSTGDEQAEQLVISSGNILKGLDLVGDGTSGFANVIFETTLPNEATGPAVMEGNALYIPCVNNKIYELNLSGQLIDSVSSSFQINDVVIRPGGELPESISDISFAALAHLNIENAFDLIAYSSIDKLFFVRNYNGSIFSSFQIESDLTSQFILADMDGNNVPDIVFTLKDGIYAYSVEGFPVSGFPIRPKFIITDSLAGTPLALDANSDGLLDLIVSTKNGQIFTYSISGEPVAEYQLSTGGSLSVNSMVIQLDADEELELAAITDSGNVYAWQLEAPYNSENNIWLQANYNSSNLAFIDGYKVYQSIGKALMPPKKVYNYPNPNKGEFTNIRYYLNEPASVKIRILDAAGALVDEFDGPGFGQTDNEIPWNVSEIASGVYICQVEAKFQSKTERQLIKIMVIH